MNWELIAEKVIPTMILAIIGAIVMMYMDVEALKAVAQDYKSDADKLHIEQNKHILENRDNMIQLQERDKNYLTKEQYYKDKVIK